MEIAFVVYHTVFIKLDVFVVGKLCKTAAICVPQQLLLNWIWTKPKINGIFSEGSHGKKGCVGK